MQITIIQEILSNINLRKGESECQYYIDKMEYLDDKQRDPLIDNCKALLCHGELRNKSGSVRIYNCSPYYRRVQKKSIYMFLFY